MENINKKKSGTTLLSVANYAKNLLTSSAPGGVAGKGIEIGMGAMLAKTAFKRLPVPLNFLAPIIVEKVILTHGVEEGREVLLKGLRWIKKATDETDSQSKITKANVNL